MSNELAKLAFTDPENLKSLNAIIHPLVLEDFLLWCDKHRDEAYTVYESALLFESGFAVHFDHTILVISDPSLAMARVMQRDGISRKDFLERRSRQQDDTEKVSKADHIIRNLGDEALIPQVITLHRLFLDEQQP